MICANSASLIYHDQERDVIACNCISLHILKGEFVGILGPSGSGKSSLLYLLSGLKNPTNGTIKYNGNEFDSLADDERSNLRLKEFGFVFQQPFLIGYLSALENVSLCYGGLEQSHAEEMLVRVGLEDKIHRMPSELSGGEKQRVCVARALVSNPKVVFADEPTASLDHAGGEHVVHLLRELSEGSLVMVTHDPTMLTLADRTLRMEEGGLFE